MNLLGATYNTDNYGVRVLLSSTIQALAVGNPHLTLRVLDYQREGVVWNEWTPVGDRSLELVNLRFSWKLHLPNNVFRLLALAVAARLVLPARLRNQLLGRNPWLRRILEAKANLSLAGGDSFSDIYGLSRLLYVALPQVLVLLLGRPLVQLPQTYGPFRSRLARLIARYLLRNSQVVCSRDRAGVATVRALLDGHGPPVEVVPDVGFLMQPDHVRPDVLLKLEMARHRGPLIGLNVSKLLFMGGYLGNNMFLLREDYPLLVRRLIKFLIQEMKGAVLLVPHVCGGPGSEESEVALNSQLFSELATHYQEKVVVLDERFSHRELKTIIGKCDLFIGARMHACIAAVSQCVPTIALAYSDKFAGVMEFAGDRVRVVDLRRTDAEELFAAVQKGLLELDQARADLKRVVPEIQAWIRHFVSTRIVPRSLDLHTTRAEGT